MKKILIRFFGLLLILILLPALPALKGAKDKPQETPFSDEIVSSEQEEVSGLPSYYRVVDVETNRILKVTPAEYLKGVAAAELPAGFQKETIIAQMVASHSYALTVMAKGLEDSPQISDDPAKHQGYLTEAERRELYGEQFEEQEAILDAAAKEAICWLLTSDGKTLLPAVFHSCSAGMTESAENVWGGTVPCLTAVESAADLEAPDCRQEFFFTLQEIKDILAKNSPDSELSADAEGVIRVMETSPSGTVLTAEAGGISCSGQDIRRWFSLPSACFTVTADESGVTFVTLGKGHGVGMSQYGAEQIALNGKNWKEILAHYYPGSVLLKIFLQDSGI